jgi:hypothetical protein
MSRPPAIRSFVALGFSALAALAATALTTLSLAYRPATALPLYSTRQGLPCAACHFDRNGGGPRNDLGFLYSRNRHELGADSSRWADLVLSNKLGDALYVGTNLRLQYTYVREKGSSRTGVSTFFPMQGALYVAFAPYEHFTLVYSRDLRQTRDAWGMIHSAGVAGVSLKAGQFRNLFGLRQDDHTSAMRAGFRDAVTGSFGTSGFAPFDPRDVDAGIEVAAVPKAGFTAMASLTNGGAVFTDKAQAVAAKLMVNQDWYMGGISAYDNFQSSTRRRASRLSYYGGIRVTPHLVLLGEVGAGTDDDGNGVKHNLRGLYGEAAYRVNRAVLLRGKYDFIDLDRSVPGRASERFALESDFTMVPFADLKVALRRVIPEDAEDEDQLLLQWHFYY